MSLRPEQVPQVREALYRYRQAKETLEAISERIAVAPEPQRKSF